MNIFSGILTSFATKPSTKLKLYQHTNTENVNVPANMYRGHSSSSVPTIWRSFSAVVCWFMGPPFVAGGALMPSPVITSIFVHRTDNERTLHYRQPWVSVFGSIDRLLSVHYHFSPLGAVADLPYTRGFIDIETLNCLFLVLDHSLSSCWYPLFVNIASPEKVFPCVFTALVLFLLNGFVSPTKNAFLFSTTTTTKP